ncbi:hypothetical protein VFPPC_18736 [Pochonia chlamydosporia 170]|uniref:Uncharacterized protein n=1 Tax=Pochonia chlamydosporia 170 TaxID=1380566 RepID=A0A219AS01_METCM|nr:hypothetical protein VFPPC_18736 [Pochonia chlamydosporia 170]OWT43537.1 hypothetical protein VFPPC_18736 [Pochonia chlamydosporia 170]
MSVSESTTRHRWKPHLHPFKLQQQQRPPMLPMRSYCTAEIIHLSHALDDSLQPLPPLSSADYQLGTLSCGVPRRQTLRPGVPTLPPAERDKLGAAYAQWTGCVN